MKCFFFFLSLLASLYSNLASAQISIFNQKSTQTKYLMQQIAALKVYTDYLNKGYTIVRDGTRVIKDFKSGEFSLHKSYFGSLKAVSGSVRKHPKVAAIYDMLSEMKSKQARFASFSDVLTPGQATELTGILHAVSAQCTLYLEELLMVLEDGSVELTDDQRIKRIENIYDGVQKARTWQRRLLMQTSALIRSVEQSQKEINLQRKLQ